MQAFKSYFSSPVCIGGAARRCRTANANDMTEAEQQLMCASAGMWQATTHLLIHFLYLFVDTQLLEHLVVALQALLAFNLQEAHICQRGSRLWHIITGSPSPAVLHVARKVQTWATRWLVGLVYSTQIQ
jgi:hypothetical protein